MCQSVPPTYEATPLSPHDYPLWIKGFGALVVLLLLASFVTFPPYLIAGRQLHHAQSAYENGDFPGALEEYNEVLRKYPGSGEARLGAVESLFSEHNAASDDKALSLLQGVELDKYDWRRIKKVMPEKYLQRFDSIDKKSGKSKSKSKSEPDAESQSEPSVKE